MTIGCPSRRSGRGSRALLSLVLVVGLAAVIPDARGWLAPAVSAQTPAPRQQEPTFPPAAAPEENAPSAPLHDLPNAMVRLPLAALLGAALALRPKRRGTPDRTPAVVQTQIILSVVGAVIMLVVGASLARAFGIVGAANLIRYRAKIEDPKDAGVMLCALAVGLAAGVGLYALSIFSTAFLVAALSVIESFAPKVFKHFEVAVKAAGKADGLRASIEQVLHRYKLRFELRTTSADEVCYDVRVPFEQDTARVTNALLTLDPKGDTAVEWTEKKDKLS